MPGTFTMEKLADTTYPIEPLLERRWSPRAFADRPVEPEKLLSLLEAARWSASCANQQPWYFVVAAKEDTAEHERLLSCLRENNQQWASHAPVLMVSVAKLAFDMNGQPNRYAFQDVGLAVANQPASVSSAKGIENGAGARGGRGRRRGGIAPGVAHRTEPGVAFD